MKIPIKNLAGIVLSSYMSVTSPLYAQAKNRLKLYEERSFEENIKTMFVLPKQKREYDSSEENVSDLIEQKTQNTKKIKKPIYKQKLFLISGGLIAGCAYYYIQIYNKKNDEITQSPDDRDPIQPPGPLSTAYLKKENLSDDKYSKKKNKRYNLIVNISVPLKEW